MRKSFVYRLYPTASQEKQMESVRDTCRHFYNDCLEERKTAWEEAGVSVHKFAQMSRVKDYKKHNPFAAGVRSHCLQLVVDGLDKAFQAFFRRVKAGETPGYPRFKGCNRFHGFGFKELGNGFSVSGRRLKLGGIGRVAIRWHRKIEGEIKTLRVVCKAGKWYACFSCELDEPKPLSATGKSIGIDVGLASLITTSEGEKIGNPRWYRHAHRLLRVRQRSVARKQKGGRNRRKAIIQLQRASEHVANTRKDFLNKLANRLVNENDLIAVEDLKIPNMVRNHCLSKSILDAGWGYFTSRLSAKAENAGRTVVFVNPAYTSKSCSGCGSIFESMSLSDRWIKCECGISLDRDHNAAINIRNRAGRVRSTLSSPSGGLVEEAAAL